MRIAVSLYGTDRACSGLGTYVREMIPRLALRARAMGGEVSVLGSAEDPCAYRSYLGNCREFEWRGPEGHAFTGSLVHWMWITREARRRGGEVLLLPAANRRVARLGASDLPTIGVVHDLAAHIVRKRYDRMRVLYAHAVVTPALRRMAKLIAVSEQTRRDLATALRRPADTISLIPNGVDTARFFPDSAEQNAPYVLYASRLEHPGKNHLRLVEAFAQSRLRTSHRLVLAGPDWGASSRIRAHAVQVGVGDRVDLTGRVPDERFPALMRGAAAVAMVGLYEGFGLPILEALASGVPVVASRTGALPDVAGPLGNYCDPVDVESITRALESACSDGHRARVRTEGPVWANRWSWDRSSEKLFRICVEAKGELP